MATRAKHDQPWVKGFRSAVRASTRGGWWVREHRGRMRLETQGPDGRMQSVALPFDWSKSQTGDAIARVRSIYRLVGEGHSLRTAAMVAAGESPQETVDWAQIAENFRIQKLEHGNSIQQKTWETQYAPVIRLAVELLDGYDAPTTPAELIERCIRDWAPGSRVRQIRAQSVAQMLRHAVQREKVSSHWMPPNSLRHQVGTRSREAAIDGQKGDPFTDVQILTLLDGLPNTEAGRRWADAIRLMAELGLRPIELLHLSVRTDANSSEPYWWCTYRKRSGGGITDPRRLFPLPLMDSSGEVQQWNLLNRWQARLIELPPLSTGTCAADCIKNYLSRKAAWISLRESMKANAQRAVIYSFRHSFSLRGHQRGIDAGSMAHAMGHSFEVHCRSYPWASTAGTIAAFDRASWALRSRQEATASA